MEAGAIFNQEEAYTVTVLLEIELAVFFFFILSLTLLFLFLVCLFVPFSICFILNVLILGWSLFLPSCFVLGGGVWRT